MAVHPLTQGLWHQAMFRLRGAANGLLLFLVSIVQDGDARERLLDRLREPPPEDLTAQDGMNHVRETARLAWEGAGEERERVQARWAYQTFVALADRMDAAIAAGFAEAPGTPSPQSGDDEPGLSFHVSQSGPRT